MIGHNSGTTFIITQFEEKCSEYTEMVSNPHDIIVGAMASKILELYDKIEYLERRVYAKEVNSGT